MRILYFSFFIVIVDQVTKFFVKGLNIPSLGIALKGINYGSSVNVIDNVFQLTYIENPGIAFGIEFGGKPLRAIIALIAAILIIYLIYKNRNKGIFVRLAYAFILGGALGNLINRLFDGLIYGTESFLYGNVVDFFYIPGPVIHLLGKTFYSWPVFNIADLSVTIGFLMLVFGYKKILVNKSDEVIETSPGLENNIDGTISEKSIIQQCCNL